MAGSRVTPVERGPGPPPLPAGSKLFALSRPQGAGHTYAGGALDHRQHVLNNLQISQSTAARDPYLAQTPRPPLQPPSRRPAPRVRHHAGGDGVRHHAGGGFVGAGVSDLQSCDGTGVEPALLVATYHPGSRPGSSRPATHGAMSDRSRVSGGDCLRQRVAKGRAFVEVTPIGVSLQPPGSARVSDARRKLCPGSEYSGQHGSHAHGGVVGMFQGGELRSKHLMCGAFRVGGVSCGAGPAAVGATRRPMTGNSVYRSGTRPASTTARGRPSSAHRHAGYNGLDTPGTEQRPHRPVVVCQARGPP